MRKGTVSVLSAIVGAMVGGIGVNITKEAAIIKEAKRVDKFKGYYNLLNQWLSFKQEGKSLSEYFKEKGYYTIAIYGMGELGNRLIDELKGSNIVIKYGIDKQADYTYADIDMVSPEDELAEVDAVVVTAIFAFDEIAEELNNKLDSPILSLEDVVFEI